MLPIHSTEEPYIFASLQILIGAFMEFKLVWTLADFMNAITALMNLPVILFLGKKAFDCLDDYRAQKKAGKDPVFHAKDIGITGTDFWN